MALTLAQVCFAGISATNSASPTNRERLMAIASCDISTSEFSTSQFGKGPGHRPLEQARLVVDDQHAGVTADQRRVGRRGLEVDQYAHVFDVVLIQMHGKSGFDAG